MTILLIFSTILLKTITFLVICYLLAKTSMLERELERLKLEKNSKKKVKMKKMLTNDEINLTCLCCKNQIKDEEDFYDIVGCIFCKRCVDSSFKKYLDAQIFKNSKK